MAIDMTTTANGSAPGIDPEVKVPARAARRRFPASYKMRILAEYDTLTREGKGALLRP